MTNEYEEEMLRHQLEAENYYKQILVDCQHLLVESSGKTAAERHQEIVANSLDEIDQMIFAGKDSDDIAFELGIPYSSLYDGLMAITGLNFRDYRKKVRVKKVMQLYSMGVEPNTIAHYVGIHPNLVRSRIREHQADE